MAVKTLARMSILAVVFLVTSAFGQTVTFAWPQCSSIPSGFSGVCQNADLSMTFVWASTQTFPPDATKLSLSGGTLTGPVTFASGQLFTFAAGQTFPPPILPLPYDATGAAFITGPGSVGNGLVPQFTAGTGKLSSSGLQVANIVASTNSVTLPESRITNLTSDLASKQATLPAKNTVTIGTTQIAANSCTSAATVSVPGTTTASVINFTPSSDITGVVGWGTSGGLVIASWPTQDTVNYRVCNQSNAAITPSASVTFNVGAR